MRNLKEISYSQSRLNLNRLFAILLTLGGLVVLFTAPVTLVANWNNALLPVVMCLGIMAIPYIYALIYCFAQWFHQAEMKEFLHEMRAAAEKLVKTNRNMPVVIENHFGSRLYVMIDENKPGVYELRVFPSKESTNGVRHFDLGRFSLVDANNRYRPISVKLAVAMTSLMLGHLVELIDDTVEGNANADETTQITTPETELHTLLSGHGIEG